MCFHCMPESSFYSFDVSILKCQEMRADVKCVIKIRIEN